MWDILDAAVGWKAERMEGRIDLMMNTSFVVAASAQKYALCVAYLPFIFIPV